MNEPKAKRPKRRYDEAFRRTAVALVESTGRPLAEIAGELGVSHWNLRDWIKLYGRGQRAKPAEPQELEREIARLRRDNESLRAQRDVLKKALGILAEPSGNASRAGRRCKQLTALGSCARRLQCRAAATTAGATPRPVPVLARMPNSPCACARSTLRVATPMAGHG